MNRRFPSEVPQPLWWAQHHPTSSEAVAETASEEVFWTAEKEHMFEKPLTPSDVGKLNRLVIPKQHAEKYFPLAGGSGSDSGVDSGLLLSFEDESGKSWEFRYSYWNSSQSYVLTKGWSRYVKEKGLDTSDVVVFGRLREDVSRMFIGYRSRMAMEIQPQRVAAAAAGYPAHDSYPTSRAVVQSRTTPSDGKSKILRLFGVNLEYQLKPSQNDASETLSRGSPSVLSQSQAHYEHYFSSNGHTSYPQNYMEYNLSEDSKQMRYHQG